MLLPNRINVIAENRTMPVSETEKEFVAHIVDLMRTVGTVTSKRMFGGHGIFLDGMMFALIADSELYLKVDVETKADFEAIGLEAFSYTKNEKTFSMSYHHAPESALEDADVMTEWAKKAVSAALRAAAKKRKK